MRRHSAIRRQTMRRHNAASPTTMQLHQFGFGFRSFQPPPPPGALYTYIHTQVVFFVCADIGRDSDTDMFILVYNGYVLTVTYPVTFPCLQVHFHSHVHVHVYMYICIHAHTDTHTCKQMLMKIHIDGVGCNLTPTVMVYVIALV